MDYEKHFNNFVASLYKTLEEAEVNNESIKVLTTKYEKAFNKIDKLTNVIEDSNLKIEDPFVPNKQFQKLMGISPRTAQIWRDEEKIGYSQISDKIFYRKSDIEKLLNDNYHSAKEKGRNK
ncbi:MAG: helix-turn-helix domain-containing protein [Bacteroidia bacterium]